MLFSDCHFNFIFKSIVIGLDFLVINAYAAVLYNPPILFFLVCMGNANKNSET